MRKIAYLIALVALTTSGLKPAEALDQPTGALLEVRSFRQGTIAVRLIPAPNLFDALVPSSRAVTR